MSKRATLLSLLLSFCSVTLMSSPALASDGVVEINETCAVQTGCFSGDFAGYPVTIDGTAGRSYQLTSNLVVPNETTDGVQISTSDVSLDLNHFTILRAPCVDATSNCAPTAGFSIGIEVTTSSTSSGTAVHNGSIIGMGSGVFLGAQSEVRNLRVRWSRFTGIRVREGSTVSGNAAYQNGGNGISTEVGSTVTGNTAYQNDSDGIDAESGSTVTGNTVYGNGTDGIEVGFGSTVTGNSASQNGGAGISSLDGSTIQRNTVRDNTGFGLNLGSGTAYRENVITDNTAGTVSGGVNMGSNSCNGTATCL